MSTKKGDVSLALEESFKALVLKHPFEKITIKMITDRAGLIRPTFYNHFADKYEVLEKICYKDIFQGCEFLIENNMAHEAIQFMFSKIENNKSFYVKVVRVTGQNSFEDIISKNLKVIFNKMFEFRGINDFKEFGVFSIDDIAQYYAKGLTFVIQRWIEDGIKIPSNEIADKYEILMTNSLQDIINKLSQ